MTARTTASSPWRQPRAAHIPASRSPRAVYMSASRPPGKANFPTMQHDFHYGLPGGS